MDLVDKDLAKVIASLSSSPARFDNVASCVVNSLSDGFLTFRLSLLSVFSICFLKFSGDICGWAVAGTQIISSLFNMDSWSIDASRS